MPILPQEKRWESRYLLLPVGIAAKKWRKRERKMLERVRNLNRYQKGILLLLLVMALVFAGVYSAVISREGFLYKDEILVPGFENGSVIYSGKIQGMDCTFTVSPDKAVLFRCGNTSYGPYTAVEDPTAIPENDSSRDHMTGVEVRNQDKVIFRGGIMSVGSPNSHWIMVDEEGLVSNFTSYAVMSDGTVISGDGKRVDPMEPSVSHVLRLMQGPELTHKGDWYAWISGLFVSVIAVVSILFADELFRLSLAFQVRNVEHVEPSDWEIMGRYVGWTVMTVCVLVIYITGLQ